MAALKAVVGDKAKKHVVVGSLATADEECLAPGVEEWKEGHDDLDEIAAPGLEERKERYGALNDLNERLVVT
jgi:hypothetical protein